MKDREELFKSDFGVGGYDGEFALIPVSAAAFEDMLEKAAARAELPVDDGVRIAVTSYLHHLDNSEQKVSMSTLATVVRAAYSRHLTYIEGQKAKLRNDEAAKEAMKKEAEAAEERSLKLVQDEPQ